MAHGLLQAIYQETQYNCIWSLSRGDPRQSSIKTRWSKKLLSVDIVPAEQRKVVVRETKIAASNSFEVVAMEWPSKQKYTTSTYGNALYLLVLQFLKFGKRQIAKILPIEVLEVCRIAEKEGLLEKSP